MGGGVGHLTQKRRIRPREDEGRDWSDATTAKDHWMSQEAGRRKQELLAKTLKGARRCHPLDLRLGASRAVTESMMMF